MRADLKRPTEKRTDASNAQQQIGTKTPKHEHARIGVKRQRDTDTTHATAGGQTESGRRCQKKEYERIGKPQREAGGAKRAPP